MVHCLLCLSKHPAKLGALLDHVIELFHTQRHERQPAEGFQQVIHFAQWSTMGVALDVFEVQFQFEVRLQRAKGLYLGEGHLLFARLSKEFLSLGNGAVGKGTLGNAFQELLHFSLVYFRFRQFRRKLFLEEGVDMLLLLINVTEFVGQALHLCYVSSSLQNFLDLRVKNTVHLFLIIDKTKLNLFKLYICILFFVFFTMMCFKFNF